MPVRQSVMFDLLEVTWVTLLYAAHAPISLSSLTVLRFHCV